MSVHLSSKEALNKDLEKRFAGGESDVELAFRTLEAQAATLATSQDDYCHIAVADEIKTSLAHAILLILWHATLISNMLRLDRIKI